ncbi:MAG: helix-turn-helix domain-containing protein [Prevotella sp.]|nr:helix-turn-helix domain-containing protein [Prevotella sp.]
MATPRELLKIKMLEKLISKNSAETIILTDVKTLRAAFVEWVAQEEEKRRSDESQKLVSKQEAAKLLGVDISTLWRWKKEKYLLPIKIGSRVCYRLGDVNAIREGGVPHGFAI